MTTAAGLTLPGAVSIANVLFPGTDITFDPTIFTPSSNTIILAGSQLALSDTALTTTITGPAAGVTISGNGKSRVLEVNSNVTATLSGLTISDSSATYSGGLEVMGKVTVTGCTFMGNTATISGGGIQVDGTATLISSTLSGNSSKYGGAINDNGTLTLEDCTISGNTASVQAGGLRVFGTATAALTDSIVAGNTLNGSLSDIGGNASGSINLIGVGTGLTGISNGIGGNQVGTTASPINPMLAACWATTAGRPKPWPSCPAASPSARSGRQRHHDRSARRTPVKLRSR